MGIGLRGEANPSLEKQVDCWEWVALGQLGEIVRLIKKHQVDELAFVGGVSKLSALRKARPDWMMLKAVAKLRNLHDDGLLRAIAGALEAEGITVIASTRYLEEVLAPEAILTRKGPDSQQERDIELGLQVAEAMAQVDLGQTVVVKQGNVIAVEAAEGTDACIRRSGELAGPGIVVVKRCKSGQDLRFDLPAVGPGTIESIAQVQGAVLAVQARRTVLIEASALIQQAEKNGIVVLAK